MAIYFVQQPISNSLSDDLEFDPCAKNICGHTDSVPYNGDVLTPVFEWRRHAYQFESLVNILMGEYEPERLCVTQPVNAAKNVSFLVDNSKGKILMA